MSHFYNKWSIAIYTGASPLALAPHDPLGRPTLTARDVTDMRALAVADPFLLRRAHGFEMFFEVVNAENRRGEIAFATSADGLAWVYGERVMAAPFHLSYPQVFEHAGAMWMVPETRQAGEVALYRADDYPRGWAKVATLLTGNYADATLHREGDDWYLFALRGLDELRLFRARTPQGPWAEHPASPLYPGNRRHTRPGGRVLRHGAQRIRLAQDGWPSYGSALRGFEITRLDPLGYAEQELPQSPLFTASKAGWNALAMHHLDALELADGTWLGAVDGATMGVA